MIVLLFGPPGCGKGTQASHVAERFQIPAISTGEMFRAECKAGTELGTRACSVLARGGLVDDEIVNAMVARRISRLDCDNGFLLDGYPRTVQQAQFFSRLVTASGLEQPVVIHIDVPDEVLVTRLTARRQCPQCLHIYNRVSQPPLQEGKCDQDGADLITREDDQEPVIRQRLRAYQAVTGPILEWYNPSEVQYVDGAQAPGLVADALERLLDARTFEPAGRLAEKL